MKFHGLDLLMLSFFSSKIFFSGDEILLKSYLKIDMLVRKKASKLRQPSSSSKEKDEEDSYEAIGIPNYSNRIAFPYAAKINFSSATEYRSNLLAEKKPWYLGE